MKFLVFNQVSYLSTNYEHKGEKNVEKALQVFVYNGEGIRVVEINGDPYFVCKDVANSSGLSENGRCSNSTR